MPRHNARLKAAVLALTFAGASLVACAGSEPSPMAPEPVSPTTQKPVGDTALYVWVGSWNRAVRWNPTTKAFETPDTAEAGQLWMDSLSNARIATNKMDWWPMVWQIGTDTLNRRAAGSFWMFSKLAVIRKHGDTISYRPVTPGEPDLEVTSTNPELCMVRVNALGELEWAPGTANYGTWQIVIRYKGIPNPLRVMQQVP